MTSTPAPVHDNRKYERIKLFLPGQLFNPLNEQSVECKVLNLSAGGAAVQCDAKFPAGLTLVLYIENFGRFEGTPSSTPVDSQPWNSPLRCAYCSRT
jgi:hypothetical protein